MLQNNQALLCLSSYLHKVRAHLWWWLISESTSGSSMTLGYWDIWVWRRGSARQKSEEVASACSTALTPENGSSLGPTVPPWRAFVCKCVCGSNGIRCKLIGLPGGNEVIQLGSLPLWRLYRPSLSVGSCCPPVPGIHRLELWKEEIYDGGDNSILLLRPLPNPADCPELLLLSSTGLFQLELKANFLLNLSESIVCFQDARRGYLPNSLAVIGWGVSLERP